MEKTQSLPQLTVDNRAFRYGDGFFESIRAREGKLLLWPLHWARLRRSLELMGMELSVPEETLYEELRARILPYPHARLRLTFYRGGGGFYQPNADKAEYVIEEAELPGFYSLNEEGLEAELYEDLLKPMQWLSNIKSCNALISVMASRYAHHNNVDDCLLLNTAGRIAEATATNVFLYTEGTLLTPPLSEGCVDGAMRTYILQIAQSLNIPTEERPIRQADLAAAEEAFLTNAIKGPQWLKRIGTQQYWSSAVSSLLMNKLRESAV